MENKSDQTPACVSPIDFITGEKGSDSSSSSGNTSSSSSWGDDLEVETLIQSIQRRLMRKRKPRKRRSLKEIQEIGPVDENLKMEKQKVVVVVPPGFLQPLSQIAGPSLDGENIDSSRKQALNPVDCGSSKTASSSFIKVARKRGRPRKKTASGECALPNKKSKSPSSSKASHIIGCASTIRSLNFGDYGSSKTASPSLIKVARKRRRPRKKTASGNGVLPYKKSTSSHSTTLNMSRHVNPSHSWNSSSMKSPPSSKASQMIDCASTIRSSNIQLVSSLQELDTVITGDGDHEFPVRDGATKFKDESVEAAAALDTNVALEIDKSDLLEKKLKETKKLGEILATTRAEEQRKAAEEEHKLRKSQLVSSLQELDTVITGDDEQEFSVRDGATKSKDDENLGLRESVEASAAAALDTYAAPEMDKSDLLEKKLKETKKLGEILATTRAEEQRKAAEEEHKLRKRLAEATETIEALQKKLMFYRTSSCITSIF